MILQKEDVAWVIEFESVAPARAKLSSIYARVPSTKGLKMGMGTKLMIGHQITQTLYRHSYCTGQRDAAPPS